MTFTKRISEFLTGMVLLICAGLMVSIPDEGFSIAVFILLISLFVKGIKLLAFYFSMARFMVGGLWNFYKGIIYLDLGLCLLNAQKEPVFYVMIYLVAGLIITGVSRIMISIEAQGVNDNYWIFDRTMGVGVIVIALLCLFFKHDTRTMTYIYCLALLNSAIAHIVNSFKKTAIVYVE